MRTVGADVRTQLSEDILGLHGSLRATDCGLRTADYRLRTPGSPELPDSPGSPILIVYRGSGTRSVEADQSSHSPLLLVHLLLYATTDASNAGI